MARPLSSLLMNSWVVVSDKYKHSSWAVILLRPNRPHQLLIWPQLCQGRNFIFSIYRQDKQTKQFGSTEVIHFIVIHPLTQFQGLFLCCGFVFYSFNAYLLFTAINVWKWNKPADSAEGTAPHHLTLPHTSNLLCLFKWMVIMCLDSKPSLIKRGYELIIGMFCFQTNCHKSI